ncbi:choice-of-anchor D domain-containing protein [Roseibium suaedae]|uniref:choice-of-anchor D domain-containing protein n=1 Tax=Roseibium suaedae TaxID=735517 RepID=UPI000932CB5D|nr:choice-of-anchor D domain-containing protein [Roseibium suaedae]
MNSSNQSAVSFSFSGAETGTTYNYTISSSGGGTNVTGSGTISSASQTISGINVSGLNDGTLTLSATLTDAASNTGTAATDTATKDTAAPSGYSVTFDQDPVTSANQTAVSFTFAGAELAATYNYTISSSGGGTNVTGSGTIALASQTVSSLDVSGLGDGTLTLSVTLTDTNGNTGSTATDTATKSALIPEIAVSGSIGGAVADGGTSAQGSQTAGSPITVTYTVTNSGTGNLTLGTATVSGTPSNVTVNSISAPVSGTVAPGGGTTTFTVQYTPTIAGAFSFNLTFVNNDSDENPYNFTVSGTATGTPEIAVVETGQSQGAVADGGTLAQGTQTAGTALTLTFTVTNSGTDNLTLATATSASPLNVTVNSIGAPGSTTVAPSGGTTTFTVQYTPTVAGNFSFDLSFVNNDLDENPYNFTISGTATGTPEIAVAETGQSQGAVADGGTLAQGTQTAGTALTLTFTVTNSGTDDLTIATATSNTLTNVTVNSIGAPASTTVAPSGGTTTFTVQYTPTVAGAFSFNLSFVNDDSNENPYNFTISGTATGTPEISVSETGQGQGAIADGGTLGQGTQTAGSAVTLTFTVTNSGTDSLTLATATSASPSNVTVNSISAPGSTTVANSGGTTTFTVQYTPTIAGNFSFELSFVNNDTDENPYNFTISGTATGSPEIAVAETGQGQGGVADGGTLSQGSQAAGSALTLTFTLTNSGTDDLTIATATSNSLTNVTVNSISAPASTSLSPSGGTTTFTVQYTPTVAGAFSFNLSFVNDDADENPYNFTISGTATGSPEIAVSGSVGGAVTDGGTNAQGSQAAGTPVSVTYTVTNSGTDTLTIATATSSSLTNVTVNSIGAPSSTSIAAAGGTATFTVQYTPTITGAFSFDLSFVNDDADENPFNFTVSGTASGAPEIDVSSSDGGAVSDGGTNALSGTKVAGTAASVTYTITNSGTGPLTITSPTVASNISSLSNVTVDNLVLGSTTVAPAGGTTTLVVTYTPEIAGAFSFDLALTNTDSDETPYDITVTGTASGTPEIAVSGSVGGAVTDGGTNAQGSQAAGTPVSVTYTVTNSGTDTLTIATATSSSLTNVTVNSIGAPSSTSIAAAGGTATFTVQYTPTITGAFSFDLSFVNDDADENPFNFTVSGTASGAPEIDVSSSDGGAVSDGGTNALSGTKVAGTAASVTYTITNSGTGPLTITSPTVASNISSLSNVTVDSLVLGSTTVAPAGGTTTLIVTYTPENAGAFSFNLALANTDGDETPYDITVSGTASGTPEIDISSSEGGTLTNGGTNTLTATKSAGAATSLTYTITNTGTDALLLSAPTIAANVSAQSNVTVNSLTLTSTTVAAAGGTTDLTINYTPSVSGAFSFDLSLASNDADENPFDVTISGTASALPEIGLSSNDGGTVSSGGTNTLAQVRTAGAATTVVYTISNTGLAPLSLTTPTVAGNVSGLSNVVVNGLSLGATSVAASGSTTLTVTFTPQLAGAFGFSFSLANSDSDENPYAVTVSGTAGGIPEIAISSSEGGAVASGGTDTVSSSPVAASAASIVYTITNSGTEALTLTSPTVAGNVSSTSNVTVDSMTLAATSVPANGGTTTLTVGYTPTASGNFAFSFTLANNDPDENPYSINVSGRAASQPTPDLTVWAPGGGEVSNGSQQTVPTPPSAGAVATMTYTITNPGGSPLSITQPTVGSSISGQFNVDVRSISLSLSVMRRASRYSIMTAGLSRQAAGMEKVALTMAAAAADTVVIPAGGTATLAIDYVPVSLGDYGFTLSLTSDDPTTPVFRVTTAGTAVGNAEMAVSSSEGGAISNGGQDSIKGNRPQDVKSTVTYTITNSGNADLVLTPPSIASSVSALTNVTVDSLTLSAATLPASGGSATLAVTYTPKGPGSFGFTLSLANNDPDDNPFVINAAGNALGLASGLIAVSGSDQEAVINQRFGSPLVATVVDSSGQGIPDVSVTFTAPSTGASLTFESSGGPSETVTTNAAGVATSSAMTANETASTYLGGRSFAAYDVIASSAGLSSVSFSLTNGRDSAADVKKTQDVIATFVTRRADRIVNAQPELVRRLMGGPFGQQSGVNALNFNASPGSFNSSFQFSLRSFMNRMQQPAESRAKFDKPANDRFAVFDTFTKKQETGEESSNPLLTNAYAQSAASEAQEATEAALAANNAPEDGEGGEPQSGFDLWLQGSFNKSSSGSNKGTSGIFFAGVDYRFADSALVGIMGQLDITDEENRAANTAADGTGWMVGPYTVIRLHQNLYFDARATYGQSYNRVNALGLFYDDFTTNRLLLQSGLTGDFQFGDLAFNPFAKVTYYWEEQEGYTDTLGNWIPSQDFDLGRLEFGPQVTWDIPTDDGLQLALMFGFSGIYDFDLLQSEAVSDPSLESANQRFRAKAKGGVAVVVPGRNIQVKGEGYYDGIGAKDFEAFGGALRLSVPF